jgi:hypothetical protein
MKIATFDPVLAVIDFFQEPEFVVPIEQVIAALPIVIRVMQQTGSLECLKDVIR